MANYYDILNNSSPVLEQNLYQDRNMKGAFKASFDYSVATNFTAYGRNKLGDALGLNDVKIPKEKIKEEFGLDVDQDLSRPQINHRIKLNELEAQMGKSIQTSGKITGTVNTVLGALAGAFVDPAALLATWGTASVVGGVLKGLKAYKLANIMRSGSFAQKYGARLGTYGAADAGVNIKIGQGIVHNQGEDYGYLDYFVDGAFGAIFGAAFPINLPKLDIPDAILPPKVPTPKQLGTGRPKGQKSIGYDERKQIAANSTGETKLAGYDEEIVLENLGTGEVNKTTRRVDTGGTIITTRKGSFIVEEGSDAEKIAKELGEDYDAVNVHLDDPVMQQIIKSELVDNPDTGVKKVNLKKKKLQQSMIGPSVISDDFFEFNASQLFDSKSGVKLLDDGSEFPEIIITRKGKPELSNERTKINKRKDIEDTVDAEKMFDFVDALEQEGFNRNDVIGGLKRDGKITSDFARIYAKGKKEGWTAAKMADELNKAGAKVDVTATAEGASKIINKNITDAGEALEANEKLKSIVIDMAEQRKRIEAKKNKDKK